MDCRLGSVERGGEEDQGGVREGAGQRRQPRPQGGQLGQEMRRTRQGACQEGTGTVPYYTVPYKYLVSVLRIRDVFCRIRIYHPGSRHRIPDPAPQKKIKSIIKPKK